MSPRRLSRILKDPIELDREVYGSKWWNLVGKIISCPLCDGEAVIVPFGVDLPVVSSRNIPCHCAVGTNTGFIIYHWCARDQIEGPAYFSGKSFDFMTHSSFYNPNVIKENNKLYNSYFFFRGHENRRDVCNFFKVFVMTGKLI